MPHKDREARKKYFQEYMRRWREQYPSVQEPQSAVTSTAESVPAKTLPESVLPVVTIVPPSPPPPPPADHGLPAPKKVYIEATDVYPRRLSLKELWTLQYTPCQWDYYPAGRVYSAPYETEPDPKKQGFACYKGSGRCCMPLMHQLPRKAIVECDLDVRECIFYREVSNGQKV